VPLHFVYAPIQPLVFPPFQKIIHICVSIVLSYILVPESCVKSYIKFDIMDSNALKNINFINIDQLKLVSTLGCKHILIFISLNIN
jgi:hypothetical protein